MLDFKRELDKLLERENAGTLPDDALTEAALAGQRVLTSLGRKQSELALQVEEIFDIVGNLDVSVLQDSLGAEKRRADALADALVGVCDILEDFCAYAQDCGDTGLYNQARMMWGNAGRLLERCGFVRLGEDGQPFDPAIHTAHSAVDSPVPREHVARVLQCGYRYMGAVARKAVVLLSTGNGSQVSDGYGDGDATENRRAQAEERV